MSTDRPDDLDAPDEMTARGERMPPDGRSPRPEWMPVLKPGFGFWMAVFWCVLYVLVMQVLAAIVCGLPIYAIAIGIEVSRNGNEVLQNGDKLKEWMEGEGGRLAMMSTLICSHLIGLLFGWLILRWQCGRSWKRKIALTRMPSLSHTVLVLIGIAALMGLSAAIERPILKYIPSIQDLLDRAGIQFEWPGVEVIMPLLQKTPWGLAIFAVAVLPGINEELWCRGFLGQGLSARYRTWVAVLIASFLFGVIHMEPRQGVNAMLLGAAIHGAYLATRSLPVAMFIHFAHNGLAVAHVNEGIGVPVLEPIEDLLNRNPMLLVATATFLFAAVGYALYQTRCKLVAVDAASPVPEPASMGVVEVPPPESGLVVAHDPLSPASAALVVGAAVAFGLVLALA